MPGGDANSGEQTRAPTNVEAGVPKRIDLEEVIRSLKGGRPMSAEELLPLVYGELRWLANHQMARRGSNHTVQPTELVHEAWLRLSNSHPQSWESRSQFITMAAQAMRWILVEHVRRKQSLKRGGQAEHEPLDEAALVINAPPEEVLAVHEALDGLEREDAVAAQLVNLRYFVGMTMEEAAASLGLGKRTAEKIWTYARLWLQQKIREGHKE